MKLNMDVNTAKVLGHEDSIFISITRLNKKSIE